MVAEEINLNAKSFKTKQCFLQFRKDTTSKFGHIFKRSLFLNNKFKFRSIQINKKYAKLYEK